MFNLSGKVAIVTGASKGIGAAVAKTLAAKGAAVVVNFASSKSGADKVVEAIAALDAPPTIALTSQEILILDEVIGNSGNRGARQNTLQLYLIKLARLRGYLARASDPPADNTVVWGGLRRATRLAVSPGLTPAHSK